MRYDFCHTIHDDRLGVDLAYDIEVEVELSVELDAGVPPVTVDGVFKDGKNLFGGTALAQMIAAEIANAAENDDGLIARTLAGEGITYRSRGANDPDGRFERAL